MPRDKLTMVYMLLEISASRLRTFGVHGQTSVDQETYALAARAGVEAAETIRAVVCAPDDGEPDAVKPSAPGEVDAHPVFDRDVAHSVFRPVRSTTRDMDWEMWMGNEVASSRHTDAE